MVQPRADGREAARAATIALADAGVEPDDDRLRERPRVVDAARRHRGGAGDRAGAGRRAASVPVSGTKALYGHPLGASGAIEAAICALAIRDGWAPASVNLAEPDPDIAALLPCLLREGRAGDVPADPVDVVRLRRAERRARVRPSTRGIRPSGR